MAENNNDNRIDIKIVTELQRVAAEAKIANTELGKTAQNLQIAKATLDKMGNVKTLTLVNQETKKIAKSTQEMQTNFSKFSKALSTSFNLGKLYLLWNITKRIRDTIKGWITASVDFIETTNKFEVAMGKASDQAYSFQNKLANAFGTVTKEMMNYQATFKNIMSSLPGLTNDAAEKVSETLVKLGLDYSSLYNVDQSTAMSRIQSALVGSVKPIRNDAGYDITEATIGRKSAELGITTSVRNLNQMEKRLLRIIVLMDQMRNTGAMQDLARTIEQPANQIKVLKNQVQELGVWLGNVFIGTIGRILPYINGFVMALVAIVKTLAIFVGYTNTGSGLAEGLEEANDASQGIAAGVGGAAKSAKELRKALMGFDVLNVIQRPSDSSGGGGGGGGSLDAVDPKILNALKDYDNLMGSVQMKATQIRDKIMDWLGFTKIVNEETGEITWKLGEGYTRFNLILDLVKLIGLSLLSWKISKGVTGFFTSLGKLTKVGGFKVALGLTLLITGISIVFNGVKKILNGDLSISNLLKSLGGSAFAGLGSAGIATALGASAAAGPIGWTVGIGLALVVSLSYIFKTDKKIMRAFADAEGLDYDGMSLKEKLLYRINLSAQIMGLKEGKNPLVKEMKKMWNDAVEKVKTWLEEAWQKVSDWFESLPGKIYYWIGYIAGKTADYLINEFPKKLQIFWHWLTVTIPEKLTKFFTETIPRKWDEFVTWIKNIDLKEIAKNIVTGFINGFVEKWNNLIEKVSGWIDSFIKGFKDGFGIHSPSTIFEEIGENTIQGFTNGLITAWEQLKTTTSGWVEQFKQKLNFGSVFDNALTSFNNFINNLSRSWQNLNFSTKNLNFSAGGGGGGGSGGGGARAGGGTVNTGELFVAREAGPELVGSIGNTTTVMNNQQIVEAVSSGVASAVASVLGNGGSSYQLIIDGEQITDVVQRRLSRRANITGMAMGV